MCRGSVSSGNYHPQKDPVCVSSFVLIQTFSGAWSSDA